MRGLVEAYGPLSVKRRRRGRPTDAYGTLVRAIVGQQLSTKAAASIFERVLAMFGGEVPSPEQLIAADPDALRGVGLSRAKVAYLRDLAERVADGELELDHLAELPDAQVVERLTAVKGIGQWSADMFLIFHLGRPDVLASGDLGIRRAAERAYGLSEIPDVATLTRMAEAWRPYRSLACLYLWASLDNEPV
jgi:DNA-3-methyladenine glycosylase II